MGTGFAKKKKQSKHLHSQLAALQQSLSTKMDSLEVEGSSGNGLVAITLSGTGEMKKIRIKPECVDPEDIEGLEALVKAAHNEAFKEIQKAAETTPSLDSLQGLSGLGLGL